MEKEFIILHLSDAHLGIDKRRLRRKEVFNKLFNKISQQSLNPNLIVFSGDLVWGELKNLSIADQFEEAQNWIQDLYKALGTTSKDSPIIFSVGNHDMDRLHRDLAHDLFIENLSTAKDVYDLMEKNDITWQNILKYQEEWKKFVINQENGLTKLDALINCQYIKISYEDRLIGVASLNSSWASYQEKEKGKIWFGEYQIDKILDLLKDCDFKILVTHFPTSWLNACESTNVSQKIQTSFNIHYYGHEHDAWYQDMNDHLKVAAGACYQDSEKEKGYSWTKIDFGSQRCELILMEYTEKSKTWKPMVLEKMTNERGIAVIKNLFANSQEASEPPSTIIREPKETQKDKKSEFRSMGLCDFVGVLTHKFSFRWEPHSMNPDAPNTFIYWPVRLRKPNPIHAVQTFVAAGLQQLNCKVILSLDNLGNIEINENEFYKSIKKWFTKVGGDFSQVSKPLCEETIKTSNKVWVLLEDWFKNGTVQMKDVLLVTKLINDFELNTKIDEVLSKRKPKRLMSPGVVWGGLLSIIDGNDCGCTKFELNGDEWYITLGGYDERNLWKTGREKTEQFNDIHISHLFNHELFLSNKGKNMPILLSEKSQLLEWDAEEDIIKALRDEYSEYNNPENIPEKSMIHWIISGCILLPSYLTGKDSSEFLNKIGIDSWNPKVKYNFEDKLEVIAKEVSYWIIS